MVKRISILALVIVCCTALIFAQGQTEEASWPSKDINVYIFSSQGGGTDSWVRFLAPIMEESLGVNIICTNLPGANGGTAAQKVWTSPHDGYTILGGSETSMFFGSNDVAPTSENWDFSIAAGSGGIICVSADSPYKTIDDLIEAAKNNPGTIKISNSGQGKGWHIKAVTLENAAGVKFKHLPYNGSGPAITALLSGESDAVSCSTGEISEYIRGGLVRPLVMTESYSTTFEGFDGTVPAAGDIYPESKFYFENLFQWLGFLMPADCPKEALDAWHAAFEKAIADPRTEEFAKTQNAKIFGLCGEKAASLAKNMEAVSWYMAKDLGIAKVDPEVKGIARP